MTDPSYMDTELTNDMNKLENNNSECTDQPNVPEIHVVEQPTIEVAEEFLEVADDSENITRTPVRKDFEIPPPPPPTPVQGKISTKCNEYVKQNSVLQFKIIQEAKVAIKILEEDCGVVMQANEIGAVEEISDDSSSKDMLTLENTRKIVPEREDDQTVSSKVGMCDV